MKYKFSKRSAAFLCAVLIALSAASCRRIDEDDLTIDIDSTDFSTDEALGNDVSDVTTEGDTATEDTAPSPSEESTAEEDKETSKPQKDTEKHVETKAPVKNETTKKPTVTTDTPSVSSPDDKYRDNVYLNSKDIGGCTTLRDNVLITFIFLNDSESSWDNTSRSSMKTALNSEIKKIESEASSYGVSLSISSDYKNASISSNTGRGSSTDGWVKDACKAAGFSYSDYLNWNIANSHDNIWSAPVVFLINKDGRAYATSSISISAFEFAVIFNDTEALRHELYHLYGAHDYYYPDDAKKLANKHFGENVMLDSDCKEVDSLTAYLIGWTDTPDKAASAFLDATSHFTQEYVENAHKDKTITGYGTVTFSNRTYTGYMVDGMPHGYGKTVYNSGDVYEGENKYDKFDGKGTYTWADGTSYSGEWKNDLKHGQGTYIWNNGDKYEGSFVDDKKSGYGVFTKADGSIYTGNWTNGKRSGQGSMTWASGCSYTGEWANDALNGYGTYTWANGTVYVGYWKDNLMHGEGSIEWANGCSYTGEWANDKLNGYGTYNWADGAVYVGYWKDDLMHGEGTLTYPNGYSKSGTWENNVFIG